MRMRTLPRAQGAVSAAKVTGQKAGKFERDSSGAYRATRDPRQAVQTVADATSGAATTTGPAASTLPKAATADPEERHPLDVFALMTPQSPGMSHKCDPDHVTGDADHTPEDSKAPSSASRASPAL